MENQLDEHLMYAGDTLFGNNGVNFINTCSAQSALPELTLSDSDKNFPDNIVSAESSQLVSNLALLTEPLPLSLPEIESTFSQVTTPNSTSPFSAQPFLDGKSNVVNSQPFESEAIRLELPPTSNSCAAEQNHCNRDFVSHLQHEPAVAARTQAHPVNRQAPAWQLGSLYVMNCNNNNINDNSQPDISNSNYFGHDKQNRHENSTATHLANGMTLPKKSFFTGGNNRTAEISSSKYSPDGKKRGATKKRKKRSANEPQKPVSAYALFFRDTQASIKSDNPSATFGEISKVVASMWEGLSEEAKQVYKQKTETAKRDYLKQLAAFRANLVSKGSLNIDDDDSQTHQLYKAADQRSHPMSSFYPSYTLAQPMLPNSASIDSTHQHGYEVSDVGEPRRPASNEIRAYQPTSQFLLQNSSKQILFKEDEA